jgi:hypothetical protein
MILNISSANHLLTVVQNCRNLRKVTCRMRDYNISREDKAVYYKIQRQCEMNRIEYTNLLAAEVPLALWPLILAKIGQQDVSFSLVCEKNDLLFVNLHNQ